VSPKFLLLHGQGEIKTSKIYELFNEGPRIYSKQDLIDKNYPDPSGDLYLIYEIKTLEIKEFNNSVWDIAKLSKFKNYRNSPKPISISLSELMKCLE
jgi:hypothetical protein